MATPQANIKRMARTRQIIYALVIAAVALPYVIPVPIAFKPSSWSKKLYDRIDELEPGSHVLISFDYDPASEAELYPMSKVLLRHCYKNGLIPIVMTHWPDGEGMCKKACDETAEEAPRLWNRELVSGQDFVLLGFKPGGADLILNMGEDLRGAFDKDIYGQPTAGMAALEGVDSLKDIDMAVDLAAGIHVPVWIGYGSDRFGFPLGAGTTAVIAPKLYTFLQSNQLVGFLGGLRGAADYEKLLEQSGTATRGMQAQSVTHLLLIVLVLGANARFIWGRLAGKEGN
ncbi:MAG: hypothetical protein ACYS8X_06975 [Planctomycetota bacterium]|jgi:hypothetical protein